MPPIELIVYKNIGSHACRYVEKTKGYPRWLSNGLKHIMMMLPDGSVAPLTRKSYDAYINIKGVLRKVECTAAYTEYVVNAVGDLEPKVQFITNLRRYDGLEDRIVPVNNETYQKMQKHEYELLTGLDRIIQSTNGQVDVVDCAGAPVDTEDRMKAFYMVFSSNGT